MLFDLEALASLSSLQYTVCDIILLIQIYYYRWARPKELTASLLIPEAEVPGRIASEETPLISEREGETTHVKTERSALAQGLIYGSALVFVLLTGVAAWAVDEYLHRDQPREPPRERVEWRSQVLGWISAVMYSKFFVILLSGQKLINTT